VTASEIEVPVPEWVPAIVRQIANFIADATPDMPDEVEALLTRLLTDERMRNVWEEIGKHQRVNHRTTGQPHYGPRLPPEILSWAALAESWRARSKEVRALGGEADGFQLEKLADAVSSRDSGEPEPPPDDNMQTALAMATLFGVAASLFLAGLRTVRQSDFEGFTASLRAQGNEKQAEAYERQAVLAANTPYIVTRQRTDARVEAFVKSLGHQTKSVFGNHLYGVVATLTNVAFDEDRWDRQRIRALLRR